MVRAVTGVRVAVALLSAAEERVHGLLLDRAEPALVLAVAAAHAAGVGGGHAEQVIAEVEVTPGAVALLLERLLGRTGRSGVGVGG